MALHWVIDSRQRLMTAVAEGGVSNEEANAYLDAMAGAQAGGYRRLFDGSEGEPLMDDEDIMGLAARMRGMQQLGQPGPLAVVMPRAPGWKSPRSANGRSARLATEPPTR